MKDLKKVQEFFSKPLEEAKEETAIDMAKRQLNTLGVKYEMSKTDKVRPFKVIYKPINKSDKWYDAFDKIVDLFNLTGVVKSSMNEANGFKSGKEFINIKLQKYPKAVAKINQLISMVGESNFTMEMAEWLFDFFNNASFESPVNEAKEESYMISKSGPKSNPYYVLEKPDGSKQIDMMFTSPEEAKKYATKKNLKISSKPGYNMNESKIEEGLTPLQQYVYDFESDVSGEDFAEEEKENIMNLKTVSDVKNYYSDGRGWMDDSSLRETLINLLMDLSSKFPNLKEATKKEETRFHQKLDTLVHNTFGKRKGEMEEVVNYSPEGKDKIYSLISQALQQGKLTKDAQAVFMKWMADPNSTEEAIIKALESITGSRNVEETLLERVFNRIKNDQSRTKR